MRAMILFLAVMEVGSAVAATPQRRRAVLPPAPSCLLPTLSLVLSKTSVCRGEPATLFWDASDPNAVVTIGGVGVSLPASGSRPLDTSAGAVYTGHATNGCGSGRESLVELKLLPEGTLSLTPHQASLTQGQTTTLNVSATDAGGWSLFSTLGNTFSPMTGSGSRSVIYTATRSGFDTVTLGASSNCRPLQDFSSITINAPPVPQPQPPSGTLRCCDGTLSPTCTSCANKKGCCSSHGGVCGC